MVIQNAAPSVFSKPSPVHVGVVALCADRVEARAAKGHRDHGRGMVVVQIFDGPEEALIGFIPQKCADLLHVMALGVPEEAAVSIVESVRVYDFERFVPVVVAEQRRYGGSSYSFLHMELGKIED